MFCGSVVRTPTSSGNSVPLFTDAQFISLFGRSFDKAKDCVCLMNGDGGATGVHFDGCTYLNGTIHATFAGNVGAAVRINYIVALA